jgi:Fe-S cluster assembly iron-binding protein IscA
MMITVTDAAKKELDAYFADNTPSSIRVFLAPGGCSGPRLALALDEPKDTDTTAEEKGYMFCMNNELLTQVSHVTVNFSHMGFSVDPDIPLNTGGGGCGGCSSASGGCSTKQ